MKQQRFDEAQIIGSLKQQKSGVTVAQICREHVVCEGIRPEGAHLFLAAGLTIF